MSQAAPGYLSEERARVSSCDESMPHNERSQTHLLKFQVPPMSALFSLWVEESVS